MKTTFIIMGATGDLTKKKLIPAIYHLVHKKKIKDFAIIGASFSETTPTKLMKASKPYVKDVNQKDWDKVQKRFIYHQMDFHDEKKYDSLNKTIKNIEKKYKLKNRLFYLATLPQHFKIIAKYIGKYKLTSKNWSRLVFEKPFGNDLRSAILINKCLKSVFKEKQVYRIDHYLGKELVQNISVLRFTNTVLDPLWNNKYIDHVQIIMAEKIGVKGREKFYDKYGALKDVIQNHMLQLLSLVAMEQPKQLDAKNIRDEKLKVLKKVKFEKVVLGQYNGYEVKNSKTETLAAIEAKVNNPRWKGIPFYILAGKKLKTKITKIRIQFKNTPCLLFKDKCNLKPNHLTIDIQPNEGFHFHLNVKEPGKTKISPVKMDFCHGCIFGANTPEAYENLLSDVMKGDQSVFIRSDEIEEAWKIIDRIKKGKLEKYLGEIPKAAKIIDWKI